MGEQHMSLDVTLTNEDCIHCGQGGEAFSANITHNLNRMAEAAGIYNEVWRPEENGIQFAHQLKEPLTRGIAWLEKHKEEAEAFDDPGHWGTRKDFIPWL